MAEPTQSSLSEDLEKATSIYTKLTVLGLAALGFIGAINDKAALLKYTWAAFIITLLASIWFWWFATGLEQSPLHGVNPRRAYRYAKGWRIGSVVACLACLVIALWLQFSLKADHLHFIQVTVPVDEFRVMGLGEGGLDTRKWAVVVLEEGEPHKDDDDRQLMVLDSGNYLYFEIVKNPNSAEVIVRDVSVTVQAYSRPRKVATLATTIKVPFHPVVRLRAVCRSKEVGAVAKASHVQPELRHTQLLLRESFPQGFCLELDAIDPGFYTLECSITVSQGTTTRSFSLGGPVTVLK
jgi:hypothetical protein